MKKINSILLILATATGFTNCTKTEIIVNDGTYVYATTDAATKTALASDYKVLWSTGDQIKFIRDDAPTTTYSFTLSKGEGSTSGTFTCTDTPENGTYAVYYPATFNGMNWPAQTYVNSTDISGAPMKATATVSGGSISDISFNNEGGILRYTVKGDKTIKSINVKSASPALDVTLDCGSGVALTAEGTVFNIAVPAGTYSNATLKFVATDNTVATKSAVCFKVSKNMVSLASFDGLTFLPAGALSGKFSVSDTKQVYFSKGNLQATYSSSASTYTWGFAVNQYSHIGNAFGNTSIDSQTDRAVVDLFGWSTDITDYGISTSGRSSDYSGNFKDWGNTIDNKETWRTLTCAEWNYLIKSRTNLSCLFKCGVTICGNTDCLIIAPDGFIGTIADSYDASSWPEAEASGLVCLPAAGVRQKSEVNFVGGNGYYWSSSDCDDDSAYFVLQHGNGVRTGTDDRQAFPRQWACSVRLVTEVK